MSIEEKLNTETTKTPEVKQASTVNKTYSNQSPITQEGYQKPKPKVFLRKKKTKKYCLLCKRGCLDINYKDVDLLKNYLKKYNKIITHKISGNCLKHQHQIANAIKRARIVALLPFVCP